METAATIIIGTVGSAFMGGWIVAYGIGLAVRIVSAIGEE